MNNFFKKRWIIGFFAAGPLVLVGLYYWLRPSVASITLPDGSLLHVEAVTYGTNHLVGPDTSWRIQQWKRTRNLGAWFAPVGRLLLPTEGQSRLETRYDSVVLWVNWYTPSNALYRVAREVLPVLRDEHGCGFHPSAIGNYDFNARGLPNGFNRAAFVFDSFPARLKKFDVEFSLRGGRGVRQISGIRGSRIPIGGWSNQIQRVQIRNPRIRKPADWQAVVLPKTQSVQEVRFIMDSLGVRTNSQGYGITYLCYEAGGRVEPLLHAPEEWERPQWAYEDSAGNRGPEFCQHEPAIKCTATVYPSPKTELPQTPRVQLPLSKTPSTADGIVWQTNVHCGETSFRVVGLWGPGTYIYQNGWLTNGQPPQSEGEWRGTSKTTASGRMVMEYTHTATNHLLVVQNLQLRDRQRLQLRVKDDQDNLIFSSAHVPNVPLPFMYGFLPMPDLESPGRLAATLAKNRMLEAGSAVIAVHLPPEAEKIALEFSVITPRQAEFFVRPPPL